MRTLYLLLCFFSLCDLLHAQNIKILYNGDLLSEKERRKIEQIIYHEAHFYSQFGLPDTLTLNLFVFNKEADALTYLAQFNIHPDKNIAGIYLPKEQKAVILGREKARGAGIGIICHELSHHFVKETIGNYPPIWLNEGLAEYFEHCEVSKGELRHKITEYEQGRIRTLYMLGEINLPQFINCKDHGDFMKQQRTDEQYAYILSHALASFWIEKVPRQILKDFVSTLQDKNDRSPLTDRIEKLYPGGFSQFEQDFATFCK